MKKRTQKWMPSLSAITFSALLAMSGSLYASGDHEHGHDDHDDDHHESGTKHDDHGSEHGHGHHDSAKGAMFLVKKEIDGYSVSFHIMKAKPGKEMGGTHDFMVKVEKDGKTLTNIIMNTKVKHPNGSAETKKTMKMGDWLMAGYDLGHEGKHQMMILFKTADGKKHKGGVYYP
ncbi:MAG: hypothetical protein GXP10_00895 [Gammaproteobacteria bacterium]|nr:hypothetical protein [Gammaproteobacteria bacterium]